MFLSGFIRGQVGAVISLLMGIAQQTGDEECKKRNIADQKQYPNLHYKKG